MQIAGGLIAGVLLPIIQAVEVAAVVQPKAEERIQIALRIQTALAIAIPMHDQVLEIDQERTIPVAIKDLPHLQADPTLQAAEAVLQE